MTTKHVPGASLKALASRHDADGAGTRLPAAAELAAVVRPAGSGPVGSGPLGVQPADGKPVLGKPLGVRPGKPGRPMRGLAQGDDHAVDGDEAALAAAAQRSATSNGEDAAGQAAGLAHVRLDDASQAGGAERPGAAAPDAVSADAPPRHGGGSILPYALGGMALVGGGVALAAGGGGGGTASTPKTPTSVDTPTLALATDSGASATDGITNRGTVAVSSLQSGGKWEYSVDNGATWSAGSGSSFILAEGTYAAGAVQVRQTAADGTLSAAGKLGSAVTVDTTIKAPMVNDLPGGNTLTLAAAQATTGVTVTGTGEPGATVSLKWMVQDKLLIPVGSATVDSAGKWTYTFTGTAIPDATQKLVTQIKVTATDVAGNDSDVVVQTVVTDPGLTVSGTVTAGSVVAGNDLTVSLYSGAGTLLASGIAVQADGTFSATKLAAGRGDVIVAVLANGPAADHLDEATGRATNLSAGLISALTVGPLAATLNINPLTTLAAREAGLGTDGKGGLTGTAAASQVDAANQAVAGALGLAGGPPLPGLKPEVVPAGGFAAAASLTPAQQAGVLLAALSGLDSANGGNAQKTIDDLVGALSLDGSKASLSDAGLTALVAGAVTASARLGTGLVGQTAGQLATAPGAAGNLAIARIAGDDVISAGETAGLTLSGTVDPAAKGVALQFGSTKVDATLAEGTWSYRFDAAGLAALGRDGPVAFKAVATLADGSTSSASRVALLAQSLPNAPTINPLAPNDLIGAALRSKGLAVSGTAPAGSIVTVAWNGTAIDPVTAGADGTWNATLKPGLLPASDGPGEVTAKVTDRFGNVSAAASRPVTFDLTAPAQPEVDPVNGLDIIGPAGAAATVSITGKGEPKGTVTVSWPGGGAQTTTTDDAGNWAVTFSSAQLPADGLATVSVVQTDAASNASLAATRQVLVARAATGPLIAPIAGGDGINLAEAGNGVLVAGAAAPGSVLQLDWQGAEPREVVVNAQGLWKTTYAFAEIPSDGLRKLAVSGTSASGAALTAATQDVQIDTQAPGIPAIQTLTSQGTAYQIVNKLAKDSGIEISGTGEAKAALVVTWGDVVRKATVQDDGSWKVAFKPEEIPADQAKSSIEARLTDALGNTSLVGVRDVTIATVIPAAPTLALKTDTGANASDGVTSDNRVVVSGLVADASWSYSIDGGETWLAGDGLAPFADGSKGFVLPDGVFAAGLVRVRQTDFASNVSPEGRSGSDITIKTAPPGITLSPVSENGAVNARLKAAGVDIRGSIDNMVDGIPVAVKVTWTKADGTKVSRDAVFDTSDSWHTNFTPADLAGPDGQTSIEVQAQDSVGNTATKSISGVSFQTAIPAAPVLALKADTGVSATDGITREATLLISGMVRGQLWEYSTDGGRSWVRGPVADSAGRGQVTLSDGTYAAGAIEVRQVDAVDNEGTPAIYDKALVIDTQTDEPTIDPIGVQIADTVNLVNTGVKSAGLVFSGTAEVGATVTIRWNGKAIPVIAKAQEGASIGRWSYTVPAGEVPADGVWPLVVSATDVAGNTSNADGVATSVTIDTVPPPAPTIDPVAADNVVSAKERDGGITVTGRTDPGTTVAVTFGTVTQAATVADNGTWTTTFTAQQVPAEGAAVAVQATATNTLKNSSVAAQRTVEIDTVTSDPVVTSVAGSSATSSTVNAAQKADGLAIAGTAEAGAVVVLTLAGNSVAATADASGKWQATFAPWQLPADGTSALVIRATDPKGNVSAAVSRSILFDTVSPTLSPAAIAAISSDNIVTAAEAASSVTVSGRVEAGAKAALRWGNAAVPVTTSADGSWSAQVTVTPGAQARDVKATVTATDAAGNVSPSLARTVLVMPSGTAAPVIAPVAIDDRINASERAGGIRVTGLGTSGTPLDLYVNGQKLPQVSPNASGQWAQSFAADQLPTDGAWELSLRSGDKVLFTRQVTVDSQAPDAPTVLDVGTAGGAGPDLVLTADEKAAGVIVVSGRAEADARIDVQWGGVTKTVTADAQGAWSASYKAGEIPADGPATVLQATATDLAGNTGKSASVSVAVDTARTGTAADDTLTGAGFGDVISGLDGNDVLVVPDLAFRKIDGGAGSDTLRLGAAVKNATLDLTHLAAGQVLNIEAIDLSGGGANHLVVDAASILADTGGANKLIVTGDADERVTALGFTEAGTAEADGHTYAVFTSNQATLWVDQTIQHVVI